MMVAKRALVFSPATPSQNATRVRRLEKTVKRLSVGEVKRKTEVRTITDLANGTYVAYNCTDISAGANQSQRTGNEVRLRSVVASGFTASPNIDVLLVHSKNGVAPVAADFTSAVMPHLEDDSTPNLRVLSQRTYMQVGSFRFTYRFNIPMKVTFDGPLATDLQNNHIWLVYINRTGATRKIEHTQTIEYTDG